MLLGAGAELHVHCSLMNVLSADWGKVRVPYNLRCIEIKNKYLICSNGRNAHGTRLI